MLPEQPKFGHFLEKSENQESKRDYIKLLVESLLDFKLVGGAIFDIWIKRPLKEKLQAGKRLDNNP